LRVSRILGIVSTILLILGTLTGLLPVASAAGLRVSVGTVTTSGSTATVPITITNGGFLSVNGLTINAKLVDPYGKVLASGVTQPVDVPAGSATPIALSVTSQSGGTLSGAASVKVLVSTNVGGFLPVTTNLVVGLSGSGGGVAPVAQTPVKHVIIIMMENHSFDNIFGVYPTDNTSASNSVISQIQSPNNLLGLNTLPAGLAAIPAGTFSTPDIPHDAQNETAAYSSGAMNGFASHMGSDSLRYFTSNQVAAEWNLAEEYGLGDNYYQPTFGPTVPNRLAALTGTVPGASLSSDLITSRDLQNFDSKLLFTELSFRGVSWGYFSQGDGGAFSSLPGNTQLPIPAGSVGSVNDFFNQLSNGTLRSVSWLDPFSWTRDSNGANLQYSEHPPFNITAGEDWMLSIVNHVESSHYWNNSAIFITYDESGGYYDHVAPPTLDGYQLGFRIPLIVVSPYAKEDYVSHTLLTHTSLPAFIDYNWSLPALSQLVLDSNLPLDFFDFAGTPRASVTVDPSTPFPLQPQAPFSQLSYPREGSSSQTLSQMGVQLWNGGP
jgi:phospholipase C